MQDAYRKGRHILSSPRAKSHRKRLIEAANKTIALRQGENNVTSKLKANEVIAARKMRLTGATFESIGRAFSIDTSHAADICRGQAWRHLFDDPDCPPLAQLLAVNANRAPAAKLNEEQVREIKRRLRAGEQGKIIAEMFGVHKATISDIKCGKIWSDVT